MFNGIFQAWSHPACTIKFATQEFTLDTLSESVHITNVTVQKRYIKKTKHPDLPEDNAWSIDDLIKYFHTQKIFDSDKVTGYSYDNEEEVKVNNKMATQQNLNSLSEMAGDRKTNSYESDEDEEETDNDDDSSSTNSWLTSSLSTSDSTTNPPFDKNNKKANIDPCLFKHVIYPAIKKCLACIASQSYDQIEKKNGRFELFGCDWLITENHQVCLLEINRSPSMEYYTPKHVTVLDELLSDLVKGAYFL